MELRKYSEKDYRYLKRLYELSFPASERAPFRFVVRKAQQGKADFLTVYIKGRCCGMHYVVPYKDMVYCLYVAMDPRVRGRGIGTKLIQLGLSKYKGKRLLLSMEPLDPTAENYEERLRRHHIYEKIGFHDLPNRVTEAGVVYALMGIGKDITPREYRELLDYYMGPLRRILTKMKMMD
uniref:GCN5-related N-acetyltransferase n=1 Tax=uncultured bacterium Contig178 TaxID=1393517 RepID=W0FK32_9BACT|nr:GCN5-related N-acetyltransferase [uncultured bacterium Contig178]